DSTRILYYRGILARLAGDPMARDFFVDAMLDPFLGPRAAAQLVEMGDAQIPAIRPMLEEAARSGTRNPEIYLALTKIYAEDVRQIEESVRLAQKSAAPPIPIRVTTAAPPDPEFAWQTYAEGISPHARYWLMSSTDLRPEVRTVVAPYYPPDLLE